MDHLGPTVHIEPIPSRERIERERHWRTLHDGETQDIIMDDEVDAVDRRERHAIAARFANAPAPHGSLLALFRENRRDLISWRVLSAPPPAIKAEAFTGGLGITPALQARRNPDPQIHLELAWRILMLVDGLRVGIVPAALKLAGHA